MPHCVIEVSEKLLGQSDALLEGVFGAALGSGLFKAEDIKVRVLGYSAFRVGLGDGDFVHVTASLLSGRRGEQKQDLAARIHGAVCGCFPPSLKLRRTLVGERGISVTVAIVDMDLGSYQKSFL